MAILKLALLLLVSLNLDIKMLQKSIIQNNCYIKSITTNVGNCLFESLGSLGLGDNDLNIAPNKMIILAMRMSKLDFE